MKTFALVFTAAVLLCCRAIADTPIATLPFTIAASGNYILASNLTYSGTAGNAITISASDVTLDLQGHRLICNAPPSNTAVAIAAIGRNDLVIRNGAILNFNRGVNLTGAASQRAIVEKLNILSAREAAIWSETRGVVIRDNTIYGTGSGFASGDLTTGVVAIYSKGDEGRIVNNEVIDTYRPGSLGVGIESYGGIVQGNRITNTVKTGIGIAAFSQGMNGMNTDNCMSGLGVGIFASGNVINRRNTCYGCTTLITGGVDGGDNQ